ncbi:hypothetical protein VPNG_07189 [Cytospora leucostoma]|uniref:Peptidase M3A/M3B catalytic domain-containing protein n=1 Tax=Cytospora leucostoma TaxID=1230097 RepID=A0A423WJU8_9PEZI|nr:hypothetical protein VPNG_07189 [Cytospora leucostoma]
MTHHSGRLPPQLPPLFGTTPELLLQEAKDIVASTQAVWDKIVNEVSPEDATIENAILPVAHDENETMLRTDIIYFLATVHPDLDVREAAKDARRLIDEAKVDLYLSSDIFTLIDAVLKKTDQATTSPETYRYLLKFHAQFLRNGCDLEGPARDQFERDTKRLNVLMRQYKSNLDNDQTGIWVTRAELDGLPTDFVDSLRTGEGESQGLVWVNMKRPHWSRIPKFARSEDLFFWDHSFYENALHEKAAAIDISLISDYFEIRTVLENILRLYERLFDIQFELVTPERAEQLQGDNWKETTWQDNVFFYSVWDTGNQNAFLGYIYFDLHPRPGKYTHVGHYNLQKGFERQDGTRSYPSAALIFNYPEPSGSRPSLLNVGEVRSLFHEVGHGMHNILSVTKFARFHGPKVDRNFVETPSIFFENFLWTAHHIREVSCHYSYVTPEYSEVWQSAHPDEQNLPPKHLTDDLIQGVLSSRESSLNILRQFHFANYDLTVHDPSSRQELEETNFGVLYNKLWVKNVPSNGGEALGQGWEWAHGESSLRLMMGDSYDAGQFAYILGRMWAVDIFDTFFAADTTNKEAGRRYREMILKPGGSQPEWKTLTDYLGRLPKPDAFYRLFGIIEGES